MYFPPYLKRAVALVFLWEVKILTIPRTNLTIGQRAFSWSSVFIWNSIPSSVRNAPTISTFKRRLKQESRAAARKPRDAASVLFR